MRFIHIGSKVPKVKPVSNTRIRADFFVGQKLHYIVSIVIAGWSFGWGCHPIAALQWILFLDPVSSDRTHPKTWAAHSGSIWPLHRFRRIDWGSWLIPFSHVGSRARNIFAGRSRKSWKIIIESVQPHGAIIGSQTPFPDDNWAEFTLQIKDNLFVVTCVFEERNTRVRIIPSLVYMSVQRTFGASIHKATPNTWVCSKRVVHYIFPIRCALLNYQISLPIKPFEDI
mmetsp:Transcript_12203/g.25711  ORF Transcript_12203/g.25711 Transcript_12203/m.25711 type:complete len:227 (-) Transcript_12203:1054-1734(-)